MNSHFLLPSVLVLTTLFVVSLVQASAASSSPSKSFADDFQRFQSKFNVTYTTRQEQMHRSRVFASNMAHAEKLNQPNSSQPLATFGMTRFADLTHDEFITRWTGYRRRQITTPPTQLVDPSRVIRHGSSCRAPRVDWRSVSGVSVVTPVKDQQQCGSCWAESVVAELESMNALFTGKLIPLSVQQVVSCDTGGADMGCSGGDPKPAYRYMERFSMMSEADYPYTATDSPCKFQKSKVQVNMTHSLYATTPCFLECDDQDEDALLHTLEETGPVSICVTADGDWQMYTSGVLTSDSGHSYVGLNHCVQLVGYDLSADVPYYIVRNSWGTTWGEQGYIRLAVGKNLAGLADEATVAFVY